MKRHVLDRPARSGVCTPLAPTSQGKEYLEPVHISSLPKATPAQIRASLAKRHQAVEVQTEMTFSEAGLVDELRQLHKLAFNIKKNKLALAKVRVSRSTVCSKSKVVSKRRKQISVTPHQTSRKA